MLQYSLCLSPQASLSTVVVYFLSWQVLFCSWVVSSYLFSNFGYYFALYSAVTIITLKIQWWWPLLLLVCSRQLAACIYWGGGVSNHIRTGTNCDLILIHVAKVMVYGFLSSTTPATWKSKASKVIYQSLERKDEGSVWSTFSEGDSHFHTCKRLCCDIGDKNVSWCQGKKGEIYNMKREHCCSQTTRTELHKHPPMIL